MMTEKLQPSSKTAKFYDDDETVLAKVLRRLQDQQKVVLEASQIVSIGTEALLTNLTCLLHFAIKNPHCVEKIREELASLNTHAYGPEIWRDPGVLKLPYLVRITPA